MATEEKKLGPHAAYINPEGPKQVVVNGVPFPKGEKVNLEERLGKAGAASILKKLSGNRFFAVEGGVDHEAEAKKKAEAEADDVVAPNTVEYEPPEEATLETQPRLSRGKKE
jgi:hypothetical protein